MIDPPWRTSTYERPFTHEGNYLVELFVDHAKLLYIGELLPVSKIYTPGEADMF